MKGKYLNSVLSSGLLDLSVLFNSFFSFNLNVSLSFQSFNLSSSHAHFKPTLSLAGF